MSKKKSFVQLEIEKPLFRNTVSWENVEDDDDTPCLDAEVIARIRSELPSVPRAVRSQVDTSSVPERGPFAVRVSNLAFTCSRLEIERFFNHLHPSKVVVSTNYNNASESNTTLNRGWAILEFASRKDVIQALELNGRSISNRSVRIELHNRENARQTNFRNERSSSAMGTNAGNNNRPFFNRAMSQPMRRAQPQARPEVIKTADMDENWRRRDPLPSSEKVVPPKTHFVWASRRSAPSAESTEIEPMKTDTVEHKSTERVMPMRRPPIMRPPTLNPPERRTHVNFGERVPVARYASIFGGARPVDTFKREMEAQRKWEEQRRTYLKNAQIPQANRKMPWKRSSSMPQPQNSNRISHVNGASPISQPQIARRPIATPPAINFWEARKQSLNSNVRLPSTPTISRESPMELSQSFNRPQPSKILEAPKRIPLRIIPQIIPISSKVKLPQSTQQLPAQEQPVKQIEKPAVVDIKRFAAPTISYSAIVRGGPKISQPAVIVSSPSVSNPPAIASTLLTQTHEQGKAQALALAQAQTKAQAQPSSPSTMTSTTKKPNINPSIKHTPSASDVKEKSSNVLSARRNKKKLPIVKDDWSDEENVAPLSVSKAEVHQATPPTSGLYIAEENTLPTLLSESTENLDPLIVSQAKESVVTATLICQAHKNTVSCIFSPAKTITYTPAASPDKENTILPFIEPPHWKEFIPSYMMDQPTATDSSYYYHQANYTTPVSPKKSQVVTAPIFKERRKHVAPLVSQNRQNIIHSPVVQHVHNQQIDQSKSFTESVMDTQLKPTIKNRTRAVVSYKLGLLLSETGEPIGPAVPDYPGQKNISCSSVQDRRFRQSVRSSTIREVSGTNNSALKQNRKRHFPNRSSRSTNASSNNRGNENPDKSSFEPFINVFPQGGWSETDFPPMCDPHLFTSDNVNKPLKVIEESFNKWDVFSQSTRKDGKAVPLV